ncbi:MAG TPA: amidase [bacterium]|nr:amidase [bacterium]HPN36685.1 amidase [bacterium]
MNRRKFLQKSAEAGLTLTAFTCTSCRVQERAGKGSAVKGASAPDEHALNEATIGFLQQKMNSGEWTSCSIVERYLQQIEAIDRRGPALNAVIELNPDALSIAGRMDEERKAGHVRGPLHGIPLLIKDNIDTGDRMMTTAGALALNGHKAERDAFIVARLRDAGAVLLGKTNLSEWANFRSTRSTSGWSSRGGQTRNPYVLDRNPCGSSSGSAVAVSANLCAVAIGTETDGSIIAPSSFCGIVGIKPTVGLWSRSGIIPISHTQDTAGPMARTVTDAAILLGALTGVDEKDRVTLQSSGKAHADYTRFLTADGLQGRRIGVERSYLKGHEGVVAVYRQAIEVLKQQGAEVVEVELLKACQEIGDAEGIVLRYEFKEGVNRYLANTNAPVRTLAEVIAFNKRREAEAMPYFKQEILESCEAKGALDCKEYTDALARTLQARNIIDDLMQAQRLDALCSTSYGLPNCTDLVNGDYDVGFYFPPPAAMAGYPHITVPMGFVMELPLGFSFIAGAYQEPQLLAMAYAFEQAAPRRRAPKFIATLHPQTAG